MSTASPQPKAVHRMAAAATLILAVGVVLAGCGGAGPASPNPTPEGSPAVTPVAAFDGLVIDVVAKGQAYSTIELEVPARAPFRILLDNQDKDFYHNVAIAVGDSAAAAREAEPVFEGAFGAGPGLQAYDVPSLAPGTYWFFCQPHANMNGTITVK